MPRSLTAITAAVTLSALLAGCATVPGGTAAPAPSISSAPAVDPKAALASAFAAMEEGRYAYDIAYDPGVGGTVLVDNDSGSIHATVTITGEDDSSMTFEYHITDEFLFMKMDMSAIAAELGGGPVPEGLDGRKWIRISPERAGGLTESMDQIALDPAYVERSIRTITQRTPHTFSGTIDLTTLTPKRFGRLDQDPETKAFEDAAKNVPFRAETDVKGRISVFTATVEVDGEPMIMSLQFRGWGEVAFPPVPGPGTYVDPPAGFSGAEVTA
ncbi:hypothetical protein [Catenuloplanes atrovinosus]|uniref:LppX_LprAFG lipoprotein n=1 Tax=Catenuloplanes atrovinosus TaxID=137266 RepID=A0AAE3YY20_9ACTN|nr:hypothetical protein [Catenuloplanes atrovinosus]MDR7280802.1 hypothetical protein [Catenuloplanes atrovinosus]